MAACGLLPGSPILGRYLGVVVLNVVRGGACSLLAYAYHYACLDVCGGVYMTNGFLKYYFHGFYWS
jgi:hypothetical protein